MDRLFVAIVLLALATSGLRGATTPGADEKAALRAEVEQRKQALEDLGGLIDQKQSEISRLEVSDLQDERENQKQRLSEISAALADNQQKQAEVRGQSEAFWRNSLAASQQNNESYDAQLEIARTDLKQAEDRFKKKEVDAWYNGSLNPEVEKLRQAVQAQQANVRQIESDRLQAVQESSDSYESGNAALNAQMASLQQEQQNLKREYDQTREAYQSTESQLDEAERARAALKAEIQTHQTEYERAQTQLQEKQAALERSPLPPGLPARR